MWDEIDRQTVVLFFTSKGHLSQKFKDFWNKTKYKGVPKSFWTGRLEQELQMVQLSATRCNCITILW